MATASILGPAEAWRPVVGHEGAYEVSSHGRVRSLDRTTVNVLGQARKRSGKVLTPTARETGGYLVVNLGRGNMRRVHALVMDAFVGPRPEGADICHADCDPTNNALRNLRYGTRTQNMADTVAAGRIQRGERHSNATLTASVVQAMRAKWVPRKYTAKMLAHEYGHPVTAVALAVRHTGNSGTWQWLD